MRTSITSRRGPFFRGFTLIELLVVVAIIVALIAILVPSLSAARGRARAVLCQSNMRQMGMIIAVFASTHDDRGPGEDTNAIAPSPLLGVMAWWQTLNAEVLDR